ncbi:MAG TPA: DUF6599 family protein [Bryobacteraceae bacterium]|jgi:hypothetical protein|nr:DUF6599 family protein [Bryobacteraceae bacterium]
MLRELVLFLAVLPLGAAILPDQIGDFARGETKTLAAQDPVLYQEFGFISAEQAEYKNSAKRFTATAWRLRDSTGAFGLFEARRPADATPAKLSALSAKTPDGAIFAYGNYVFQVSGEVPEQKDLEMLFARLPQLDNAPLPALASYLPQDGLIPNSQRYILGPVSLARFEPRIAPSLAAFHLGTEAQLGRYRTPKGDLTLVIFSYPTPNIARERQEEFSKLPGAIAKRSGPWVGVIVQPPDADAAERVLGGVQYAGNLTLNEKVPVNQGLLLYRLFLNIFVLSGVLIALSIIVGVGFGGFRILRRKLGKPGHDDPFQLLRIGDK